VDQLISLLPLLLVFLAMWVLVFRPASKRQRQMRNLQGSLQPGDRVMLSSGIYGMVRQLHEDRLDVEVSPGVLLQVARGAVANREDGAEIEAREAHAQEEPSRDETRPHDAPEAEGRGLDRPEEDGRGDTPPTHGQL